MIILYHDNNRAISYENTASNKTVVCLEADILKCLFNLSKEFKNTLFVWCHQSLKEEIDKISLPNIFHHELILASYSLNGNYAIPKEIGFVDQHCFVNVKREVTYPTWLMSSDIGGVNSSVLNKCEKLFGIKQSFDEFLCALAKVNMSKGLMCYSEPNLLQNKLIDVTINTKINFSVLFKFVKRYYKTHWVFFLLFNQCIYNKQFLLWSFCKSFGIKKRRNLTLDFRDLNIISTKQKLQKENFKIDVLIPTLGRKEHLYNVLKDLSKQTILPQKVIIVEQNGVENSVSELDYLKNNWPFEIDHTFIHQLGACNARNIALSKVTGDWVFFADDDIRFDNDLLSKSINCINKYGVLSLTISCLQKSETEKKNIPFQWEGFGTNASIVKSEFLKKAKFKSEHEFGYGEDSDFGMQLKNVGCDTIYIPSIKMLHLKAPVGGFRFKFKQLWEKEYIQPKPSPTVMAYNLKHLTKEQLKGYKTLLFINFYKIQKNKNPFSYIKLINPKWNKSIYWAKKMMNNEV